MSTACSLLLCKDRNTAAVTAQLTSQSLLYDKAGASQVLAFKQPPVAQSPLCGRAGASANEEPYKEVVPEKR